MKIKLNAVYILDLGLSAIILLGALIVFFIPWEIEFRNMAMTFLALSVIFRGIASIAFRVYTVNHPAETMDERDHELLYKSLDRANKLTQVTMMILLIAFVILTASMPAAMVKGFLFCVFGIYFPEFYKDCLFLYYQKN